MRKLVIMACVFISLNTEANQPLYSFSESPIHSNVLSLQLREAYPNQVGSLEVKSNYTQASVWAQTSDYFLDYYQNHIDLAFSYQVNSIWKSEMSLRKVTAKDNGLDELTMNFHDLFGIGQNGRDQVPTDQFYISVPELGIEITDFEGDTLTKAILSYNEASILQSGPLFISAGVTLYYNNVSDGAFARSSFEQGIQVNTTYLANAHTLHASTGLVHRNSDSPTFALHDITSFASFGYAYQIYDRHSVLVESHNFAGWGEENVDFSQSSNELLLGYRYAFMRSILEVYLTENIRNMDNSTDIALSLSFRSLF